MDDIISRAWFTDEVILEYLGGGFADCAPDIRDMVNDAPAVTPEPRWIPVTERLPEDDERNHFYDDGRMRCTTVLAYTVYGRTIPKNRLLVRPTGNDYLDSQVTDGWVWASGSEDVTHWMPLPEPPEEV